MRPDWAASGARTMMAMDALRARVRMANANFLGIKRLLCGFRGQCRAIARNVG